MFSTLASLAVSLLAITAGISASANTDLGLYEDSCPPGYASFEVAVNSFCVLYPVAFNTYIEDNTVIAINGGVQITITNAPTSLSTVLMATITSTVTTTLTISPNAS